MHEVNILSKIEEKETGQKRKKENGSTSYLPIHLI